MHAGRRLLLLALSGLIATGCAPSGSSSRDPEQPACLANSRIKIEPVQSHPFSAARKKNENWEVAALRASVATAATPANLTPRGIASPYPPGFDIALLPEWRGSLDDLTTEFTNGRDEARYRDHTRPTMKRRATWLYPYDGCAARAAHMTRSFERTGYFKPGKVFAFGNLRNKTPFQAGGTVYWWYHTAPAYRIERTAYVLDPAVDATKPVQLEAWLAKMTARPSRVRLAICDSNSYNAESVCRGGREDQDREHEDTLTGFLPYEWKNLENLGFDPERLLGSEPPWDTFKNALPCQTAPQPH